MNSYVTGDIIKTLREKTGMTQQALADIVCVSPKTVSKWETGKGLPDISLIEPLSSALGVSVIELMNGEQLINRNRSGNMAKSQFRVCPLCGNIIFALGSSVVSCCGILLPECLSDDGAELINAEISDGEIYVRLKHTMDKRHYISFIAYVSCERADIVKLYPEQEPAARFTRRGSGYIYAYCNRDGLCKIKI